MDVTSEIVEKISNQKPLGRISDAMRSNLVHILKEMRAGADDIMGALVTSSDGLPWAKELPADFSEKRFSAMSGALMALSTTLTNEAGRGKMRNVLIEAEGGNIYVMSAGPTLVLTVFTKMTNSLGLTLAHARRAAELINVYKTKCDESKSA